MRPVCEADFCVASAEQNGEADSPRWGRMGRCLSGEPLEVDSANGVGGRSSFERSPSSKSVSPGRRPSAVWGQTTRPSATRCRSGRRDPHTPLTVYPYYHTSPPKCQAKSGGESIISPPFVILVTAKESQSRFTGVSAGANCWERS